MDFENARKFLDGLRSRKIRALSALDMAIIAKGAHDAHEEIVAALGEGGPEEEFELTEAGKAMVARFAEKLIAPEKAQVTKLTAALRKTLACLRAGEVLCAATIAEIALKPEA